MMKIWEFIFLVVNLYKIYLYKLFYINYYDIDTINIKSIEELPKNNL